MRPGASRDRTSRLRPYLTFAALGLASVSALALLLLAGAHGVAHAAALDNPTPTYNPLIVPTAAAPSSSGLPTSAISTSSSGIALAFTLSCATTIAGLIIAVLTLTALMRTGYGPFLRAMLPGRRRSRARAAAQPTLRYRPRAGGPETGFDLYAEASRPRAGGRTRARDEWREWDDQPPRRPQASQTRRSSSRDSRSRY